MSLSYESYAKEKGIQIPKSNNKPGGLGGIIASLLPTGGGVGGALGGAALGASLGSVVPVIGTGIGGLLGAVLGGAGGSALGKVGENAIEGEKDLGKGVAGEALLGGLTSTPITGGLKLLKGGAKAALGVEGALKAGAQEAGASAIPRTATGLRTTAAEEIAANGGTPAGILSNLGTKVADKGAQMEARAGGFGIGEKNGGKTLGFFDSKQIGANLDREGIKPGAPSSRLKQVELKLQSQGKELDNLLKTNNQPLSQADKLKIAQEYMDTLERTPGVTKTAIKYGQQHIDTFLKTADDTKGLSSFKRGLDQNAINYNANPDAATSANQLASKTFRNTLRDAINNQAPGLKELNNSYHDLSEAAGFLKGGSKVISDQSQGQAGGSLVNRILSGETAESAKSIVGNKLKKVGGKGLLARASADAANKAAQEVAVTPVKGQGILGTVARESLLGNRPDLSSGQQDQTLNPDGTPVDQTMAAPDAQLPNTDTSQQPVDQMAVLEQGLQQAALKALASGDSKGLNNIVQVSSLLQSFAPKQTKPMSAEAAKVTSNAQSGLDSLNQLENDIQTNPGIQAKSAISSAFNPLGITGAALGTGGYEANRQNIIDVIARLRTGAAITNDEASRFAQLIPQPADSQETVAQKINMLRNQFTDVLSRTGSDGTDVQALTGA